MRNTAPKDAAEIEALETREWLESLDYVLQSGGPARVSRLLRELSDHARRHGVRQPFTANTPYINTIPAEEQPPFPGSREIERRIKSLVRWNALAMVVKANKLEEGIGGHISTFASAATLYEVGFNHFFKGKGENHDGDIIYFQGHAAPGIYARAFIEGRLSAQKLENFRRELKEGGGLSSYPHPWLMPEFWEFPTVSMGLGPICAIYQARFMRYLEDRGLKAPSTSKVWAFLGDGETDEPEALGAITLPAREKLDNLIFVINCNLQRLDGPVRGNGQIIQELEAIFRGAGWNVIKVIWGSDWDHLEAKDTDGLLAQRLGEIVDGQYQKYAVESGAYIRENFFGPDPRLAKMVEHLSDEELRHLRRGGHDYRKLYAAYASAVDLKGAPVVILAKTVKGWTLGEKIALWRGRAFSQSFGLWDQLIRVDLAGGDPVDIYRHGEPYGEAEAGSPLAMAWDASTARLLVLDDAHRLYAIADDPAAAPEPLALREAHELRSAVAIAVYRGNLYILDAEGNEVWRYLPAADGFDSERTGILGNVELPFDKVRLGKVTTDGEALLDPGRQHVPPAVPGTDAPPRHSRGGAAYRNPGSLRTEPGPPREASMASPLCALPGREYHRRAVIPRLTTACSHRRYQ